MIFEGIYIYSLNPIDLLIMIRLCALLKKAVSKSSLNNFLRLITMLV